MTDHLLKFASEADAKADSVIGAYCNNDAWDLSHCIPAVQVWQPSNDTTSAVTGPDGQPVTVTTHIYEPGWYIRIADPKNDVALAAQVYALPDGYVAAPVFAT